MLVSGKPTGLPPGTLLMVCDWIVKSAPLAAMVRQASPPFQLLALSSTRTPPDSVPSCQVVPPVPQAVAAAGTAMAMRPPAAISTLTASATSLYLNLVIARCPSTCGTHGTTDSVGRPGHTEPRPSRDPRLAYPPALAAQTAGPAGHVAVCCAVKGCRSV